MYQLADKYIRMFDLSEGRDWLLHDMRLNYAPLKMIVKRESYFRVQWSSLKSFLTMLAAKSITRFIYSCLFHIVCRTSHLPSVQEHLMGQPCYGHATRRRATNTTVMLQSWGGFAIPDTWGASFNFLLCTCIERCFVRPTPELWLAIACTLIL